MEDGQEWRSIALSGRRVRRRELGREAQISAVDRAETVVVSAPGLPAILAGTF